MWNKDYLSKVVGEVAELISVGEATKQWENLEYARIQIRVLKSCRVGVSKGYQINGQIYNICIVEEEPGQGGRVCNCPAHNYASLDNISSMETFIEETIFSKKASDEGDVNAVVTLRRKEEAKEEGENSQKTNLKLMKEHSQSKRGRQSKGELPYANEVMRE